MSHKNNSSVVYAFSGNLFITILKFVGYSISFSPSLFSEAIHSLADTGNQGLLWWGARRSQKKADEHHAYGYGAEKFFWATVSACGIFFLGAGVTIYHGIDAYLHPHISEISVWVYWILIVSFVIEAFTLYKAYNEIMHVGEDTFMENLQYADPVSIAVFYEDFVAVLGVAVAFVSIFLTKITGNNFFDAFGSVIIGTLLAGVAVLLLNMNRKYLVGRSIPKDTEEGIKELLLNDKHVEKIIDFKSEILDIGKYRIKCEIEFNGYALVSDIFKNEDMEETFKEVKDDFQEFQKFVIYEANLIPRMMGRVIDNLEKEIRTHFPHVYHIDLEIN